MLFLLVPPVDTSIDPLFVRLIESTVPLFVRLIESIVPLLDRPTDVTVPLLERVEGGRGVGIEEIAIEEEDEEASAELLVLEREVESFFMLAVFF